jgi:hypothetical protein
MITKSKNKHQQSSRGATSYAAMYGFLLLQLVPYLPISL